MSAFMQGLRSAFMLLLICTLLLGGAYPLTVTALTQILLHDQAQGSLIKRGDRIVGSRLIGQHFASAKYFWGRPSASQPPYNPEASGGSNLGVSSPVLLETINSRIAAMKDSGRSKSRIPFEMVTASASGLDPHISLAAALYQLPRVARARSMKEEAVLAVIREHTAPAMLPGWL
ncbi:MAG: potassium-transporting ATPase subunit KdpC, partial [Proteobacteria bacterium]|nr:potassium-transporting ATPase subunit KdpC [Pseudomonadota bacterium]